MVGIINRPPTAAETPEGKKRQKDYEEALGRFVHVFAKVEIAMALTLWHYAKTQYHIARVLFPRVRVHEAMTLIKQLADATNAPSEDCAELENVFQQLGIINGVRNDTLHYGAI